MTLAELTRRHGLAADAADRLAALLDALADEPDPHTTVGSGEEAIRRHLADSLEGLAVAGLRDARRIADIGAGSGFPGLPLAVALPDAHVDLIESAGRKCAVIERLAAAAELENATAIHARAEEHAGGEGRAAYDAVTARAVGPLAVLVEYAAPLLREGGVLVAWKGAVMPDEGRAGDAAAEIVGLGPGARRAAEPYPGARDLSLYVYSKVKEVPDRFPRRPGMAAKRPLG